ncbi:DEAD/DEAH box helicase family protein [Candidatus Chloroploca sp. M-50]|uniref:DEAD/DEAH box helicase family protein n=1 Tax=Candidatus Chloroploca mongolica TaxID=2528176 RepID=A0ABS4DEG2_9CHLR|nr:DEAD/DEAH box helicase family protein [Candidatus Chloroploca mongolica]MBP1467839.1 DEAD/DEAH box helicase family protein [Candidatus Chloroploca mongolica]
MAKVAKTKQTSLDFAFFTHLLDFYRQNKGRICQSYRELTRKYLAFNDPANATAFLRPPQYEALEIYVLLKEFLGNQAVYAIYRDWAQQTGRFEGRGKSASGQAGQLGLFKEQTREEFDAVFAQMRSYARAYPNYIFALTMGTGKTILMATCIFYEFILANKFPKDERYCHNALVFAPDKTVLEALREIQTFDKARVVPAEYVAWLDTNIRFHFLDESGVTLNLLDRSRFNLIISNTQKIILKRQHAEKTPIERLMQSGKPTYAAASVYAENADLYGGDELESEDDLATNQRFEKLRRLEQLGIYVDEAHHAFGTQLAKDMGIQQSPTSLRVTIDALATSLKASGTRVVACYNYTGTPYVQNQILPEVVYAFGLQEAINRGFLKKVRTHGYTNPKTTEFVRIAIDDFLAHNKLDDRHEGLRPKMAFFAATIDELQNELRPAVEAALTRHGIPASAILVNVGDDKLTSNDDIREFNRLDTPGSEKHFILLVNKGREGWNCRSLFAVALYRKPKSKIFVLQATMRCLRAIGVAQNTGHVYLSAENRQILDDELQQNFRVTIGEIEQGGSESEAVRTQVKLPVEKVKLKRVRRLFSMQEKAPPDGFSLELAHATTDGYRLIHTEREGLAEYKQATKTEDLSHLRERRTFSAMTLVAEVARYLNKPCLEIEALLERSSEGIEALLARVNEFNELLYDWVIPRLFDLLYKIEHFERTDEYEIDLVKMPEDGFYELRGKPHLIVHEADAGKEAAKSFHLDTYCFDSNPERDLFWKLIKDGRVDKLYFTGMLTHGQSDFFVQYIDPMSHTVRSYYPDFLLLGTDGNYTIVEVKGDNKIDAPEVLAKQRYAEELAGASGMRYRIIKGTDASAGRTDLVLGSATEAAKQYGLMG